MRSRTKIFRDPDGFSAKMRWDDGKLIVFIPGHIHEFTGKQAITMSRWIMDTVDQESDRRATNSIRKQRKAAQ